MQQEGFLEDFIGEAREIIESVEEGLLNLESASAGARLKILDTVRRGLHTLKGNAGMMGLSKIQQLAHRLEDLVEELDSARPDVSHLLAGLDRCRELLDEAENVGQKEDVSAAGLAGSLRVGAAALDSLVDRLAEMVVLRNRLQEVIDRGRSLLPARDFWNELEQTEERLGKNLQQIRTEVMGLRLVPLGTLFGALRRIVHDEARRSGKEVEFDITASETTLDKGLLEVASQALGHMVRNAVVHGIELAAERLRVGKPASGRVSLESEIRGDEVLITLADDGAGVDRQALAEVATRHGLKATAEHELLGTLFLPGLSTHSGTDLGAGRGIGLSAAVGAVQGMGGRIEVSSESGQGTSFRVFLPLAVSTARALMLRVDGEIYALPLATIVEAQQLLVEEGAEQLSGEVYRWRQQDVPAIDLGFLFGTARLPRAEGYAVMIEVDQQQRALLVDTLIEIREIVVKDLDPVFGGPLGIGGTTVLPDGRAVLMLNPLGLMAAEIVVEKSA